MSSPCVRRGPIADVDAAKQPPSGLNEAPLAVIWEATRFLLHCRVRTEDYDLVYTPGEPCWHHLPNLRAIHAKHRLFAGKRLPHASDSRAWKVALSGFQSGIHSVVLSAELVPCPSDTGPLFELQLHPLRLEQGHRLGRRFGADRFLKIDMPSPLSLEKKRHYPGSAEETVEWLTGRSHHFFRSRLGALFCKGCKETWSFNHG